MAKMPWEVERRTVPKLYQVKVSAGRKDMKTRRDVAVTNSTWRTQI